MIRAALAFVLLLPALTAAAQTEPVKTVSAAEAASHIAQRVEPVVPPLAKAVKIGGKVKLHIVISPSGEVSSATFLSGHPLLVQAAIDAVKQWKFKPFYERNSGITVATDVELDFPGGMSESENAVRNKYFRVEDECRSLVQSAKYAEAEPKCRQAVEISDNLPKEVVLERTGALSMLANAIFLQRRFSEAIPLYERALELDKGYRKPDDADLATEYANLGRAYGVTGNLPKADEFYETAVSTFRAAIKSLPSMYENYSRRLQRTLNEYAQLKEAEGQTEAASALRKQASEISPYINPAATVPAMPRPTRVLKDSESVATKPHTEMKCATADCTHGTFAVHGSAGENLVLRLAFTPDSKMLIAARQQGDLDIWDISSWEKVGSVDTRQGSISALAISPDGKLVGTGSQGNTVKVWNVQNRKLVAQFLADSKNPNEFVQYLAFGPDSNLLATGGNYTKGLVVDLRTQKSVASLGTTKQVQFSADGNTLIGAVGQKVLVWDTKSWQVRKTLDDPEKNVTMIVEDQPNNRIAIAGWKKGVRILNLSTGELVKSIPDAVTDALVFTAGWQYMVTGRGTIGTWSMSDAKLLCESPEMEISDIALSPDSKFIAATLHSTVGIWATESLGNCMTVH
jgi:TonB family protein